MFVKYRRLFLYHRQLTTATSTSIGVPSTFLLRNASPALFHAKPHHRAASTTSSSASQENETLRLSNGHTLSYLTTGSSSPNANPIIYFHGFPSCRFEALGIPLRAVDHLNIRIIAPERPGLGVSTHDPHRKLLDYPSQISELVKHLGLEQYRILGTSGGGPYALACAYALPSQELKATGILAGVAPREYGMQGMRLAGRMTMHAVRYMPGLVERFVYWAAALIAQAADEDFQRKVIQVNLRGSLGNKEAESLEGQSELIDALVRGAKEHFRQGPAGFLKELQVLIDNWGFKLEDIHGKRVRFWYGSQDENTPARMGTEMARRIEGSRLKIWEGDDHFKLWWNHHTEILEDMMEE